MKILKYTNSVDSVRGEAGIIMTAQFAKIVKIMTRENSPCVKTEIETRRTGLKGLSSQTASVALNRKMSFFFVTITNVCNNVKREIYYQQFYYGGRCYLTDNHELFLWERRRMNKWNEWPSWSSLNSRSNVNKTVIASGKKKKKLGHLLGLYYAV